MSAASFERLGSLLLGDMPFRLASPVIIEGEVFWGVEWANSPRMLLHKSYESEDNLKRQVYLIFDRLFEEYVASN